MSIYKILPQNMKGRDFTIGDIHGAYDLLDRALVAVNFDPAADRLISVGDLIDRGPRSPDCLAFLKQPWFHAIRGNHEDLFLQSCYEDGQLNRRMAEFNIGNGMGWIFNETPEKLKAIADAFLELPVAMEIQTERGSVGFVHADIPEDMNWQGLIDAIQEGDDTVIQTALWGRSRVSHEIDSGVRGIDRIFFGHTPQTGARRLGNCYYIDTGAVFRLVQNEQDFHLTCADIRAMTMAFNRGGRHSSGIDVKKDVPSTPFGKYTR